MNFYQNSRARTVGTSYQGQIDISYARLVETFGFPCRPSGDGDKVDAEWIIEFEDGTVATIYNYKDGQNYNGKKAPLTKNLRDWHIGGTSKTSYLRIIDVLNMHPKGCGCEDCGGAG